MFLHRVNIHENTNKNTVSGIYVEMYQTLHTQNVPSFLRRKFCVESVPASTEFKLYKTKTLIVLAL